MTSCMISPERWVACSASMFVDALATDTLATHNSLPGRGWGGVVPAPWSTSEEPPREGSRCSVPVTACLASAREYTRVGEVGGQQGATGVLRVSGFDHSRRGRYSCHCRDTIDARPQVNGGGSPVGCCWTWWWAQLEARERGGRGGSTRSKVVETG